MSEVKLLINNNLYGGWQSVSIDLSIENLAGTFNLSLTDRWAGQENPIVIKPADSCAVFIDDEVVITGYVDIVNLSIDSNNHTIQIAGRDRTADLIDCSVINGTGQYLDLKLEQIVTRICQPFGIHVNCNVYTGDLFKTFNVEQGGTALESIQKLCSARQCLAMSDGSGGVLITRAANLEANFPLVQGQNILSGQANYDYSLRFREYIVKGQQQGTDNLDPNSISGNVAKVRDFGIGRYRPLVIIADGQANAKDCKTRADWELNTRKGRSRRFTITTAGWIRGQGNLWHINELVLLDSSYLGVYDKLLIVALSFSLDDSGQITTLTLTSPDAYLTIETENLDINSNPYILPGIEEQT